MSHAVHFAMPQNRDKQPIAIKWDERLTTLNKDNKHHLAALLFPCFISFLRGKA